MKERSSSCSAAPCSAGRSTCAPLGRRVRGRARGRAENHRRAARATPEARRAPARHERRLSRGASAARRGEPPCPREREARSPSRSRDARTPANPPSTMPLTGGDAHVGNYPGITVDILEGDVMLPSGAPRVVADLPGFYSVEATVDAATDEGVARAFLDMIRGDGRPLSSCRSSTRRVSRSGCASRRAAARATSARRRAHPQGRARRRRSRHRRRPHCPTPSARRSCSSTRAIAADEGRGAHRDRRSPSRRQRRARLRRLRRREDRARRRAGRRQRGASVAAGA